MGMERRKYPRVDTSMDVLYYTGGPAEEGVERIHYFGKVTDLSLGGLRMAVEHSHAQGEQIWLQGVRGAPDVISGQVKWVQGEQEGYHIGIEFLRPK